MPTQDRYANAPANPVRSVADAPVSTFSVDVDTASYALVRRFLREGRLPPVQALRSEEMINYFAYDYAKPRDASTPFAIDVALMPTPWNEHSRLLRIGLQGYSPAGLQQRPVANITFLVDVSGSMAPADRLPLAQAAMRQMLAALRPEDRVAIVTYANGTAVQLASTKVAERARIERVIDGLAASGGTFGSDGLRLAYSEAESGFVAGAANRVILMTDGDFNIGTVDAPSLQAFVAAKRKSGIYLSVLGFGLGNLNDSMMQTLAQAGNGSAAYIDSLEEARRVLVDQIDAALVPIADDVKLQVEFNPARVAEYRLIGYETRALRREDFKNDAVDAGEIGDGHRVTALYEITAPGGKGQRLDPLRYAPAPEAAKPAAAGAGAGDEIAFVRLRYKRPGEAESRELARAVLERDGYTAATAPVDLRFAAAVAGFSQALRGDPYLNGFNLAQVAALAEAGKGNDPGGWRAEFIRLVRSAEALKR
ncbi:VWA domain-containing protein [Ferrovibrio sp.]|uniref:vWA domain-containing protein n=1 Tax=Ferrovibrio sp. TaxID=1917215 RepID=UPI001B6C533F|nr:VWA domain-containing protein [Ferrovibrio sp.]MBP7064047.1 VWA domain-containing protein [Ferrovibrio sp.]